MIDPDSAYTTTHLWVMAVGSLAALAVAFGTLPLVSPRTHKPLGTRAKVLVAPLVPLGGVVSLILTSMRRDYDITTVLQLCTLVALTMVVLRIIFGRYLRRVGEAAIAGEAVKTSNGKVAVVFLVTLAAVLAAIATILIWLPTWWSMMG